MSTTAPSPAEIEYPCSDGKPMPENDWHAAATTYLRATLSIRYAGCPKVYVAGNLFIYYEEGNPRASVSPDLFVVFGAENRMRFVYKVWEEGRVPDFVLEVASPNTWEEDEGAKRVLYQRMGVREYWQVDLRGGAPALARAGAAAARGGVRAATGHGVAGRGADVAKPGIGTGAAGGPGRGAVLPRFGERGASVRSQGGSGRTAGGGNAGRRA